MESFESNCEKAFKSVVTECFKTGMLNFAKAVAEKHELELDELLEIWNDSNEDTFKLSSTTSKPKAKSKSKAKSKDKSDDDKKCEATVKKTGEQCVFKVSDKSTTGKYCGRHLKEEEKNGDEPKAKPKSKAKAKTKKQKSDDEDNENGDDENEEQDEVKEKTVISLKRDSYGRLTDAKSGLVFNTNKEVIGKALDDGKIGKLSDEDLKVCKKYKVVVKQQEDKSNEDEDADEE